MACTSCTQTNIILSCVQSLGIGFIEEADEDVYVYIKNLNSGYTKQISAESDEDGYINADLSDLANFLNSYSSYELWVTTTDSYDRLPVTLSDEEDADTYECFLLTIEDAYEGDFSRAYISLQTLNV